MSITVVDNEIMQLEATVTGALANNVFKLTCAQTNEAVVIDAGDAAQIAPRTLITHGHHDHVSAVSALQGQSRMFLAEADWPMVDFGAEPIADGQAFLVGNLEIHAIATPGHTPGSTCFFVPDQGIVFSGDTLFPGGPGATRWAYSSFASIISSLTGLFDRLEDDVVVLPGHGQFTTIGAERPMLKQWAQRGW